MKRLLPWFTVLVLLGMVVTFAVRQWIVAEREREFQKIIQSSEAEQQESTGTISATIPTERTTLIRLEVFPGPTYEIDTKPVAEGMLETELAKTVEALGEYNEPKFVLVTGSDLKTEETIKVLSIMKEHDWETTIVLR